MSEKITEQLIELNKDGASVISEKVSLALGKKKISPSLVTSLSNCPAQWLATSFVTRDLIEEEPDNAAHRGTLFHKILEDYFALPAEERLPETLVKLTKDNLDTEEFAALKRSEAAIKWIRDAINGYYNLGVDMDPKNVVIAEVDLGDGVKKGLEVFVTGHIGEAKRPTLGFIDRLQKFGEDEEGKDTLYIEDWKSGAKAKEWNPKTKGDDGLAEQRQQFIYAIILEQAGYTVEGARMIYPVAGKVVNVDLKDEALRKRVIADVEAADRQLDAHIENNLFEYKPSALCSWCPLAKICPAAMVIRKSQKCMDARESQPEREVLEPGIKIKGRFD